ncbi:hypothetical protein [Sphingosinicella humi]|nr:hypothetical protein [Sphingosinicella humi]
MRRLLMLAGAAAMAFSMPAAAKDQPRGNGKSAQNKERGQSRARADGRAERRQKQAQARSRARAEARADRRQARAQNERRADRRQARAQNERRAERRQAQAGGRARADAQREWREVAQRRQQRRATAARQERAQEQRQAQRARTSERRERAERLVTRDRVEDRRDRRQRAEARERRQDIRKRQQRLASRERLEDRREAAARRDLRSDRRERQQRIAARERRQDMRQRIAARERRADRRERLQDRRRWQRELARDRRDDRRAFQRRLAARERWLDRERYYAAQARRYRRASYDWDDYDYRYLYRNVEPAYFYSASNFLPVGRSAPPAWAPAWGRRYNVPYRYQDIYYDTPSDYYRYDDGYIYRVDSGSNLIADVIPLLGGGFAVGQLMPVGYDAYNVPYPYRDYYYDTDDAYYRYGDGGIFQVDPSTGMIEAIVALLAGDLNIGQPLPTGYDAYNLPLQYRDQYVDNDDYIYRYADGNIYQADAQTGLIENVMSALI